VIDVFDLSISSLSTSAAVWTGFTGDTDVLFDLSHLVHTLRTTLLTPECPRDIEAPTLQGSA
jgi:hypothetical protein